MSAIDEFHEHEATLETILAILRDVRYGEERLRMLIPISNPNRRALELIEEFLYAQEFAHGLETWVRKRVEEKRILAVREAKEFAEKHQAG